MATFAFAARFCGSLLLLATLTAMGPRVLGAQQPLPVADAAWDEVTAALPGSRVKATLTNGGLVKGRLVVASADTMALEDPACQLRARCRLSTIDIKNEHQHH